jgi:hypothetical protein
MTSSFYIARLFGPVFILVALAILLRPHGFRPVLESFLSSPATLFLAGFLALLGSLAVVLVHNLWVLDWRLVITLCAWAGVLKGAVILFSPQAFVTLGRSVFVAHRGILASAATALVVGSVLTYFGYLA